MKSLLLSLLLFPIFAISQNDSYCIIDKEIYPLLDSGDYHGAKTLWLNMEKNYDVDPNSLQLFLFQALENEDIEFFQSRIPELIENHGYHFFPSDTLPENMYGHSDLVYRNGLHQWLIEKTNELYPFWIMKHPESYQMQQKIEELTGYDQYLRTSIRFSDVSDTNCTGRELNWNVLGRLDYQHIAEIAQISIRTGSLPNHFDHGLYTHNAMGLILWHNLKNPDNIHNAWKILLPHIDKAYFAGKIGSGYYASYDHWLLYHTGFQFYGFEGDAPVENQAEFEKRKERYHFCY